MWILFAMLLLADGSQAVAAWNHSTQAACEAAMPAAQAMIDKEPAVKAHTPLSCAAMQVADNGKRS